MECPPVYEFDFRVVNVLAPQAQDPADADIRQAILDWRRSKTL
jgi:hypothetical protein